MKGHSSDCQVVMVRLRWFWLRSWFEQSIIYFLADPSISFIMHAQPNDNAKYATHENADHCTDARPYPVMMKILPRSFCLFLHLFADLIMWWCSTYVSHVRLPTTFPTRWPTILPTQSPTSIPSVSPSQRWGKLLPGTLNDRVTAKKESRKTLDIFILVIFLIF